MRRSPAVGNGEARSRASTRHRVPITYARLVAPICGEVSDDVMATQTWRSHCVKPPPTPSRTTVAACGLVSSAHAHARSPLSLSSQASLLPEPLRRLGPPRSARRCQLPGCRHRRLSVTGRPVLSFTTAASKTNFEISVTTKTCTYGSETNLATLSKVVILEVETTSKAFTTAEFQSSLEKLAKDGLKIKVSPFPVSGEPPFIQRD